MSGKLWDVITSFPQGSSPHAVYGYPVYSGKTVDLVRWAIDASRTNDKAKRLEGINWVDGNGDPLVDPELVHGGGPDEMRKLAYELYRVVHYLTIGYTGFIGYPGAPFKSEPDPMSFNILFDTTADGVVDQLTITWSAGGIGGLNFKYGAGGTPGIIVPGSYYVTSQYNGPGIAIVTDVVYNSSTSATLSLHKSIGIDGGKCRVWRYNQLFFYPFLSLDAPEALWNNYPCQHAIETFHQALETARPYADPAKAVNIAGKHFCAKLDDPTVIYQGANCGNKNCPQYQQADAYWTNRTHIDALFFGTGFAVRQDVVGSADVDDFTYVYDNIIGLLHMIGGQIAYDNQGIGTLATRQSIPAGGLAFRTGNLDAQGFDEFLTLADKWQQDGISANDDNALIDALADSGRINNFAINQTGQSRAKEALLDLQNALGQRRLGGKLFAPLNTILANNDADQRPLPWVYTSAPVTYTESGMAGVGDATYDDGVTEVTTYTAAKELPDTSDYKMEWKLPRAGEKRSAGAITHASKLTASVVDWDNDGTNNNLLKLQFSLANEVSRYHDGADPLEEKSVTWRCGGNVCGQPSLAHTITNPSTSRPICSPDNFLMPGDRIVFTDLGAGADQYALICVATEPYGGDEEAGAVSPDTLTDTGGWPPGIPLCVRDVHKKQDVAWFQINNADESQPSGDAIAFLLALASAPLAVRIERGPVLPASVSDTGDDLVDTDIELWAVSDGGPDDVQLVDGTDFEIDRANGIVYILEGADAKLSGDAYIQFYIQGQFNRMLDGVQPLWMWENAYLAWKGMVENYWYSFSPLTNEGDYVLFIDEGASGFSNPNIAFTKFVDYLESNDPNKVVSVSKGDDFEIYETAGGDVVGRHALSNWTTYFGPEPIGYPHPLLMGFNTPLPTPFIMYPQCGTGLYIFDGDGLASLRAEDIELALVNITVANGIMRQVIDYNDYNGTVISSNTPSDDNIDMSILLVGLADDGSNRFINSIYGEFASSSQLKKYVIDENNYELRGTLNCTIAVKMYLSRREKFENEKLGLVLAGPNAADQITEVSLASWMDWIWTWVNKYTYIRDDGDPSNNLDDADWYAFSHEGMEVGSLRVKLNWDSILENAPRIHFDSVQGGISNGPDLT